MRSGSSLRQLAAFAALAAALPTCSLLVDLHGLSGSSPADGGGVEGGGVEAGVEGGSAGDAPAAPDALDTSGGDVNDGHGGGADASADVAPEVGSDGGGEAEAGPLSYSATVLSDAPIAYWRLGDATKATAKDSSGNGHDGSYQGGVVLGAQGAIAGDPDTAVQFDGNTAQMVATVPASFDFAGNAPYSIEVWEKPASSPAGMGLVGKSAYAAGTGYSGWYVAHNSGGYLDSWRNDDETGNPAPSAAGFIHVVATYDGTTLAIYVNGQPFSSNADAVALVSTSAPVMVGGVDNWGMFTGVLDEIAIYDKVLPAARIAVHYARGTGQ